MDKLAYRVQTEEELQSAEQYFRISLELVTWSDVLKDRQADVGDDHYSRIAEEIAQRATFLRDQAIKCFETHSLATGHIGEPWHYGKLEILHKDGQTRIQQIWEQLPQ